MDYEFNAEQNKVIAGIVIAARVSAGGLVVLGVVRAVGGLRAGNYGSVVLLIFTGLLAYWLAQVASLFERIIKTEGEDVSHLVSAFRQMAAIFNGIRRAQILMLVISVISIIFLVIQMMSIVKLTVSPG